MPRAMACIWLHGDPSAFDIADTIDEAQEAIDAAETSGERWVHLTLAGQRPDDDEPHRWDGRPLRVRPTSVAAIGPPGDGPGASS